MASERQPSAWAEFGDGHDYSRTGKHDPLACRQCLRDALTKTEAALTAAQQEIERLKAESRAKDAALKQAAAASTTLLKFLGWSAGCFDAEAKAVVERAEAAEASLAQMRVALDLALSALPDSSDGGPSGSGYRYIWDECTGDEQEWVKTVRQRLSALAASAPQPIGEQP